MEKQTKQLFEWRIRSPAGGGELLQKARERLPSGFSKKKPQVGFRNEKIHGSFNFWLGCRAPMAWLG